MANRLADPRCAGGAGAEMVCSMLGVSRERVTRQLSLWSSKGILDQGRGRIIVRDRGALEHVLTRDS